MKDVIINVKNQAQNVNNVLFLNKRTNEKNESKFETIFETLYQQHLIELNKIVVYDAINFERQNLKYHEDNTFLRKFWKKIESLWKIKESNIDKSGNQEKKHNKNNTKKYLKNAKKFNDISK